MGGAGVCSLVSFLGWVIHVPALASFGVDGYPIWPLTALGYAALSFGFLAAILGHGKAALGIWTVPLLIALLSLFQDLSGLDLGTDRLLFGREVVAFAAPHPGRPGTNPISIFILLAICGVATQVARSRWQETSGLLASAALGLGAAASVLVLSYSPGHSVNHTLSSSLPAGITAILLGIGFIAWQSDFGWVRVLAANRTEWRMLRVLMPLALMLPVAPSLLELWIEDMDLLPPIARELFVVMCNITIVGALIYWTMSRVARDQAALIEVSEALESTMVVITSPDGEIRHWSRGCEELYGWRSGEARGRNKYALLHSRCEQRWANGLPTQTLPDAQEMVEIRRDGAEVAVLERVHHVESPGRQPVIVLSMTDITQASEAIVALQASEERLALATAAHELGVFEWDVTTGNIQWSPGTEERLGARPGSMPDFDAWRETVEPEDVKNTLDTIARAVAMRADKYSFRYRLRQPAGVRAVEGSARTFYDTEGNLLRTVGVILDVTEREEREAALRSSEAQLRSVLETVPDAMVVMDEHGIIREFSTAAEQLWGYRANDVLGQYFTLLAPEEERPRYQHAIEAFEMGSRRGAGEWVGQVVPGTGETADGRCFPVEIRTGIARTDAHTLFTMFFRDISERLATEERLSDLNTELAHVSRQSAMSELAADLAHELNQPLAATSNFLAAARMLLEQGNDVERATELVRLGGEQTLRAGQIIKRLRDFMAKREVEMRAESVERTVRDAVELVLVGTGQFDIRVDYELDPSVPVMFADRIQVQQVLVNLLRNATEALRAVPRQQRKITIASHPAPEGMMQIEVRDTGPGIPEALLKTLYTRFTTTKDRAGMGIGLSISRRIVEAHGGTLMAENRPEGGACFRFTLPAIQQEEVLPA